ncbi:M23 family metallopeptidase [Egbenema bharatensis]|uniref:M23 family metallopeptidase n=1 Tax=Egbenema bharatensis TaxID=3463334 RepID=UPI003A87C80C
MKTNRRMMRKQGLKRRSSKHYTVWIAREGRSPVVIAFRPIAMTLAVGLPLVAVIALVFSFVHRNSQLNRRNLKLTEEAAEILEQLESLETTITTLQERAGMAEREFNEFDGVNESNGNEYEELGEPEEGFLNRNAIDAEILPDRHWNRDEPDANDFDFRGEDDEPEWFSKKQSDQSRRGVGGAAAEDLLALARSKLPALVQEVQGEVEPALAEIIVREEAKPKGRPLRARDTEITSRFGLRSNPFGWGYEFHEGMDFVAAYGSPIYVTAAGRVDKAEWEPGYGNYVVVDHGYGYQTLYAHLSDIRVKVGESIDRNQVIGYLGNTGRSSGPHLHYTVFQNGQAVDPQKYLD